MNYFESQPLVFFILSVLSFNPALSDEEARSSQEEQDSEEFENSLLKNARDNYRHGFAEIMTFLNSINNTLMALKAEMAGQNRKIDELRFDDFIRYKTKVLKIGKSFNKSSLSDIQSHISQVGKNGSYTAVVIENHLDEPMQDLIIRDPGNFTYSLAPSSISPYTKEIFTFTRSSEYAISILISYGIPTMKIRVAAISTVGTWGAGLAFLRQDADIRTYYKTKEGIEGSSVYKCCNWTSKNLSVGYKNLHSRMFAEFDGYYKTTLRIQLIKFPIVE